MEGVWGYIIIIHIHVMDNFRFVNYIAIHIFDVFLHVHVVVKVVDGDGRVDELTHGVPVLIDLSVHYCMIVYII